MNTILEDLDHICLEIGGSRFEMKYIGCFGATGNKKRLTTWEIGDRFVSLTERFNIFVLVEEIEKTNMKTGIELQTFKDEWNHHGMDTFSLGMDPSLRIFRDNFYELISFDKEDHHFRKPTIYNLKLSDETGEYEESKESEESEESGESEESDESEESGESEESEESKEFKEAEESEESGESEESEESTESDDSDKSEESEESKEAGESEEI